MDGPRRDEGSQAVLAGQKRAGDGDWSQIDSALVIVSRDDGSRNPVTRQRSIMRQNVKSKVSH